MTIPRSEQIDLAATPFYHCHTRCVRQSYLCGIDPIKGKNYNHRRGWIVERIKQLASIFAINVSAYAVMNNHYHLVLYVNADLADSWKQEEIIERWQQLFPKNAKEWKQAPQHQLVERVAVWRERLMSVSWFLRCLNETIACWANKEDGCSGRFWEGRFKCQALLDEAAVLTAMAYVDLNPIRANMALTPESSDFTSIQERIHYLKKKSISDKEVFSTDHIDKAPQPPQLIPFYNNRNKVDFEQVSIDFTLSDYLELVDSTGRILRDDKRGAIPEELAPILNRIGLCPLGWLKMVKDLEVDFSHAVGHERMLFVFGEKRNTKLKGRLAARKYYFHQVA